MKFFETKYATKYVKIFSVEPGVKVFCGNFHLFTFYNYYYLINRCVGIRTTAQNCLVIENINKKIKFSSTIKILRTKKIGII